MLTERFTGRLPERTERELWALAVRYASAIDLRDPAALAEVFHPAGVLRMHAVGRRRPYQLSGTDAIAGELHRVTKYTRTFHLLGQSAYASGETDDRATGEVYCVAHQVSAGPPATNDTMYLRYHDVYRLDDGIWRIGRRDVYADFETTDGRVTTTVPPGTVHDHFPADQFDDEWSDA
jgi:hypothetical protein